MSTATIYHNPDCGSHATTFAMIRQGGIEPDHRIPEASAVRSSRT